MTLLNYNGSLISSSQHVLSNFNRGFKYADALFETIKVKDSINYFLEDHYFRLMASMRMLRMEIPDYLTLEFFEKEINTTVTANELTNARVRITVFRSGKGLYLPDTNDIEFLIEVAPLATQVKDNYKVDVFKDFYIYSGLLSTLKTTSKQVHILASIYAKENNFDNCLILNERKNVIEACNGNIFCVKGSIIKTPPLTEGCIKGITRKKLIEIITKNPNYTLEEVKISPFELQKSDELFITNTIAGIQPVSQYRRTTYKNTIASDLQNELNKLS